MLMLMVMAAMLRASYELSRPGSRLSEEAAVLADTYLVREKLKPTITSQQREWAEKAAKNYAQSQEKKWQRWNQAMFERVK